MKMFLMTINVPVIPLIVATWFIGYIIFEVGRCSAVHDIMDAGVSGGFPEDIETWRENWIKKHDTRK